VKGGQGEIVVMGRPMAQLLLRRAKLGREARAAADGAGIAAMPAPVPVRRRQTQRSPMARSRELERVMAGAAPARLALVARIAVGGARAGRWTA